MPMKTAGAGWLALALAVVAAVTALPGEAAPPRSLLRVETRFQGAPGPEQFPRADVIVLEDDIGFEVAADGSTTYTEHDAIKILTQDGAEGFGQLSRLYRQGAESIVVEQARTIKPDGTVLDVPAPAISDRPVLPDSKLYGDLRQLVVQFPEAAPGSVVEFSLRTWRKPRPGGQWWASSYVQNPDPILASTFTVRLPQGVEPRWAAPGVVPSRPRESVEDGRTVLRWAVVDQPSLPDEPNMPDMDHLLHRVELSSFADWAAVGAWFAPRWKAAVASSEGVGIVASGADTRGSTRDRVRSILQVVRSGRQVNEALPFNWEPHPASAMLDATMLSPVDAAVLTAALLAHVGVEARPVLASPVRAEELRQEVPDPEALGRILLQVRDDDGSWLWIDPALPGELMAAPPAGSQDVGAVTLDGDLVNLPCSSADANRRDIRLDVQVAADGHAELTMTVAAHGTSGVLWKALVRELEGAAPDQRETMLAGLFERMAGGFAGSGRIYSYYFPEETAPGRPFELSATLMFPELASPEAKASALAMPVPLFGGDRLADFATAGARLYPVHFDYPFRDDLRVHIRLPEGSEVRSLPQTVSVDTPQGSYFATARSRGSEVWYYSRLVVDTPWVQPADYGGLRRLAEAESSVLKSPLVFAPPRPAATVEERAP